MYSTTHETFLFGKHGASKMYIYIIFAATFMTDRMKMFTKIANIL